MAPARRRPDTSWLPTVVPTIQALLDQGEATCGFTIKVHGGHLILGRVEDDGPDPRFRLSPLGGGRYGLSLYNRDRWDLLPYEGTLNKMVDVMNNDLGAWAAVWLEPPL
ncbi:MAG: hypothetical protein ACR2IK_06865 [Chloroflexota bacterium]